jgi:mannitol-specific phosphotransferase system IIBC component
LEDNTGNIVKEPQSHKKETIGFIAAIVVMLLAIFTVWQVFLKGKSSEDKDTVIQVIKDTLIIKDSADKLNQINTHTSDNQTGNTQAGEIKSGSEKDTAFLRKAKDTIKTRLNKTDAELKTLTDGDKTTLKEELKKLPPERQKRIKKKLKSEMNK